MAVKKVSVPSIGTVHMYKRRGLRGMRLSVTNHGTVRVSLPHWMPYATAVSFVLQKQQWIKSQQIAPVALWHGAKIGKAHHLVFVADPLKQAVSTRVASSGEIRIYHPVDIPHDHTSVQRAAERASLRALKTQAESLLPQRLETLAVQHGFSYESVRIKQLKSRWGSCSDKRDIALSCFLMQLPWHLIDYVLLHELVHTQIMAHGPVFWSELAGYVPNLKDVRKDIKTYRPMLVAQ